MRIGVNLLALVPGRQGGIEQYARRLLSALARDGRHELAVFLPEAAADALGDAPGVRVHAYGGSFTDAAINRAVAAEGIDLLWYPWVSGAPLRAAVPAVVTVADLQHVHLPENFTEKDREDRDRSYFVAAHAARALITFSRHTRDDVVATYGVSPDRVHPIPLALGQDWEGAGPTGGELAPLRAAYGTGFLLYPAHTWPHKDHLLLLRALRRLADEARTCQLVLTGSWEAGPVADAVRLLGLTDRVVNLGVVAPPVLRGLYRLAGGVVFPSRFEGFGMPLLEAMQAGVPVLSSDATSLPEVGGDAVLYFRAGDLDALTDGLRQLLDDPALRQSLVARGTERVREFSWERTAAATLGAFEAAVLAPPAGSPTARAVRLLGDRLERFEAALEASQARLVANEADRIAQMELIERIAAEVRSIRAFVEAARPQEWHGLATPAEVKRVRRLVAETLKRLDDLVTG